MFIGRRPSVRNQHSTGPRGHRAYVVGDIHGRLDLLNQLLSTIEVDVQARRNSKNVLVFLGDLIDRGPSSAQVVERLRLYKPEFAGTLFLMGNHEEVMLRVIDGEERALKDWLKFGGAECIRSYGVDPRGLEHLSCMEAIQIIKKSIPEAHVEFVRSFADTVSFGSYLFVHAGIRPRVPLLEQRQTDLRWIRHPFLDDTSDHGFTVVHGHTITDQVEVRCNRIGLDTGAYKSGILTAVGIEGGNCWFLQTGDALGPGLAAQPVQLDSSRPRAMIER